MPTVLLAGVLAAGAAAAIYGGQVGVGLARADTALLTAAVTVRTDGLTLAARVLTEVGNTKTMAVLAVVTAALLWWRGRRPDAVFVMLTLAGAVALFRSFKILLDRARPPAQSRLAQEASESLPSGHATLSIAVIGSLVVLAWAGSRLGVRALMLVAATVWIGAVGGTRVYLGVHWFSDVVAGWLLGAAWLAACSAAWLWWTRRETMAPGRPTGRCPAAPRAGQR